jgi:catalase
VVIAAGVPDTADPRLAVLLQECLRHLKPLGCWGDGRAVLETAGIDLRAPGVLAAAGAEAAFHADLVDLLGRHRVWDRQDWLDARE